MAQSAGNLMEAEAQSISDLELAEEIAAITGRDGRSAEALSFLLLLLADELRADSQPLRQTILRSVEFAFLHTDAYRAALELYIREKRGLIYGTDTAAGLIQKMIESNSQSPDW